MFVELIKCQYVFEPMAQPYPTPGADLDHLVLRRFI